MCTAQLVCLEIPLAEGEQTTKREGGKENRKWDRDDEGHIGRLSLSFQSSSTPDSYYSGLRTPDCELTT